MDHARAGLDSTIARLLLWFQMSSHGRGRGVGCLYPLPFCLLPGGYCILVQLQTVKRCCNYGRKCGTVNPTPCPTSAVSITHTYKLTPALSSYARCSYPSSLTCDSPRLAQDEQHMQQGSVLAVKLLSFPLPSPSLFPHHVHLPLCLCLITEERRYLHRDKSSLWVIA